MQDPDKLSREESPPEVQNEEIERIAYFYWESRGRGDGQALEDWLMAEKEVLRRHSIRPSGEEPRKRVGTAA